MWPGQYRQAFLHCFETFIPDQTSGTKMKIYFFRRLLANTLRVSEIAMKGFSKIDRSPVDSMLAYKGIRLKSQKSDKELVVMKVNLMKIQISVVLLYQS